MREILKTGKDILSISFSSALSTTYQSSVIAAEELKEEFPDAKILTVDSSAPLWGRDCSCISARRSRKKGKTIDEVKTFAEETKGRVCHWFTVDDLNHLKRAAASAPPPPCSAPCWPSSLSCMWTTRAA